LTPFCKVNGSVSYGVLLGVPQTIDFAQLAHGGGVFAARLSEGGAHGPDGSNDCPKAGQCRLLTRLFRGREASCVDGFGELEGAGCTANRERLDRGRPDLQTDLGGANGGERNHHDTKKGDTQRPTELSGVRQLGVWSLVFHVRVVHR